MGKDGMDAVDTLFANTRNNPIEDIETHLPLRVRRYELREDMCGAGKWRGGFGSVREFEYLSDGGASVEGDGHGRRPWGFQGGAPGHTAALILERAGGASENLPSNVPHVNSGRRPFHLPGPRRGGFGNPFERDPGSVLDEVRDGLLSVQTASTPTASCSTATGHIDQPATEVERRARRRQTGSGPAPEVIARLQVLILRHQNML